MLGFTNPLSIWGWFAVRCYLSWGPDNPVCLDMIGGTGPVGQTGDDSQDKLMGVVLYWLKKNLITSYCCAVF